MEGVLDSHFIGNLEQKLEKTRLKRVDSETIDKLIPTDAKLESVLTEDQQNSIKDIFTKAVSNQAMTLSVEAMSPDDFPVTITMSEWMRRMKDMAKTGGGYGFYGSMPDQYSVAINGNHSLVQKILSEASSEKQVQLAKQVYDLALLSQNMLSGADLTSFIKRSVDLVG
jgi:molecular chaperone HtpG